MTSRPFGVNVNAISRLGMRMSFSLGLFAASVAFSVARASEEQSLPADADQRLIVRYILLQQHGSEWFPVLERTNLPRLPLRFRVVANRYATARLRILVGNRWNELEQYTLKPNTPVDLPALQKVILFDENDAPDEVFQICVDQTEVTNVSVKAIVINQSVERVLLSDPSQPSNARHVEDQVNLRLVEGQPKAPPKPSPRSPKA